MKNNQTLTWVLFAAVVIMGYLLYKKNTGTATSNTETMPTLKPFNALLPEIIPKFTDSLTEPVLRNKTKHKRVNMATVLEPKTVHKNWSNDYFLGHYAN